jgi:hypothetical protein
MCTEKHWKMCNTSAAYHAATKFALELEEAAKQLGHRPKTIRIRTKEQIIKGGFGKSDAQVIWEEGPADWTTNIKPSLANDIDYTINKNTVSFYTR